MKTRPDSISKPFRTPCLTGHIRASTIRLRFWRAQYLNGHTMGKRRSVNGETTGQVESGLLRNSDANDEFFMGFALNEARSARDAGEVPVGAVVVIDNQIAGS